MHVCERIPLLERSLLQSKEDTLQALVRGWMGLAQLNVKTWPRAKDVSSLATFLKSEKASIDWGRIHHWVEDSTPLPDEQPPDGVEVRHWGIDRALYGLIKNRRATLASLEETLRDSGDGPGGTDEDYPMDEDQDAQGSPSPSRSPSPSPDQDDRTSPDEARALFVGHLPRGVPDPPPSPHVLSSASRSRTTDVDDGPPRSLEVSSKAPAAPAVSDMTVHSVEPRPREVDAVEQADQTFREMLVNIFRDYGFEPKDGWDGQMELPLDEDSYPAVTLVGEGTVKIHGWDHRPSFGFPNGRAIYWPLTNIPLRYNPDLRKLVATTKDIAVALAKHTACMEGNLYLHLVHRTATMVNLIPFAAIDSEQVLRLNDNYWAHLTVGDIEGDLPFLQDIKILLEIRILAPFKSIPPAPSVHAASGQSGRTRVVLEPTADTSSHYQDKGAAPQRSSLAPAGTKARPRKAPIKHRELYLQWLRETKWENKPKTLEIRKMDKWSRMQLPALIGLVNFIAELIKDVAFTDDRANTNIQYKLVPLGVFADFLNHGEDWINGCLLIKRKLPLCANNPSMRKAIQMASKHGLGISTVVEAITAALGSSRKRKRPEAEVAEEEGEEEEDADDGPNDMAGNVEHIRDDDSIGDMLSNMEGEDWLQSDDDAEETSLLEADESFPEWSGISV
ncbi:hypothetical protein GSI_12390 [Ganoderma sinense ZZ0214-1]|uniref:Uncharacterized protein n=1 Tax=Ganoderma sinense ZZ0214-1 TaxID=1077348 RepID=A0A2G8RVL3_9APHY|nr:hypothetical protein GSI_12390 [Ganoderma sinense ZZ0214-1]